MKLSPLALLVLTGSIGIAGAVATACSSDTTSGTPGVDAGGNHDSGGNVDSGGGNDSGGGRDSGSDAAVLTAHATLLALTDAGTTGTAAFTESSGTVSLAVTIAKGTPGKHGLHVHLGTDCTNPGPHYGPDGGPYHGEWSVIVDDAGAGTLQVPSADVTVSAGAVSAVGHAMVLHALPVDGGVGPPPRIACGVITTP